ncbi:MAG: DUF937 domain-containing protein [Cyanobacteria bacterium SBLK]|nr:DUF937 domain-containing protein [Cyanobacteria bacterium SBLK]
MSLFNTILGALDSPDRSGSSDGLGAILNTVQSLSQANQANPENLQSAMSIVGKHVRSSLQEKRTHEGENSVQAIVNQFSGTSPSSQVVQILFSNPQVQQIAGEVEAKTGLSAAMIQAMLPSLVPLVLQFLQSGTDVRDPQNNSVLNAFLDADGDGDVDIADAMQMASRYLGK